jgi:aryl-alcohol dehydrogenase-like predicted oxidoreductase
MATRFFTKQLLVEAIDAAYTHNFNQSLDRDHLDKVPDTGHFPILSSYPHSGASRYYGTLTNRAHPIRHMRCWIDVGDFKIVQDVELKLYLRLPTRAPMPATA